jgi:hypothetical protein
VVTIATYSFFLAALVGRQYVAGANKPFQMEIDIYIPVFTILQFFFFMGLLKVRVNPECIHCALSFAVEKGLSSVNFIATPFELMSNQNLRSQNQCCWDKRRK